MAAGAHAPSVDLAVETLGHLSASPEAAAHVAALVLRPLRDVAAMRPDARILLRREGRAVPGNRTLLASSSPFFEALFRTPMHRAPSCATWPPCPAPSSSSPPPPLSAAAVALEGMSSSTLAAVAAYASTGGFSFRSLGDALAAAEAFDGALMGEAAAAATEAAKALVRRENVCELVWFAHGKAGREDLLRWAVQHILKGGYLVRTRNAQTSELL